MHAVLSCANPISQTPNPLESAYSANIERRVDLVDKHRLRKLFNLLLLL